MAMQVQTVNAQWYDRREAGYLLSRSLDVYQGSNSVVVGIPRGGVEVASVIAEELHLPLEVMPCRTILNPADNRKNIGSVSEDEVYIHDCEHTIPQDYICHQITKLRRIIAAENRKYRGNGEPAPLTNRSVILVDDVLTCSDTMITCLRSIRKQNPLRIIVAVAVISMEAAIVIDAEADEVIYLKMETFPESPGAYFVNFPRVDDADVKELLEVSKLRL
jgi:putative phosphoribosyl transferase